MQGSLKKIICLVLACAMLLLVCTACKKSNEAQGGGSGSSSGSTQNSGEATVLAEIAGEELTSEMLGYYIATNAFTVLSTEGVNTSGDITKVDWSIIGSSGKRLDEQVKEAAVKEAKKKFVLAKYAKENGVDLSDEEKKQIDDQLKASQEKDPEGLKTTLLSMGFGSVDAYKKIAEVETLYGKFQEDFEKNRDKYIKNEEELKKYKDPQYVSAQHILFMLDSGKYQDPKAKCEEVLKRAKAGEDFVALMKEFNEDTGETAAGYSFGPGEMVPQFEQAAFALDYNQISDVVESEYGFHIIKRIVGLAELENSLVEKYNIKVNDEYIANYSVADNLNAIFEASRSAQNAK